MAPRPYNDSAIRSLGGYSCQYHHTHNHLSHIPHPHFPQYVGYRFPRWFLEQHCRMQCHVTEWSISMIDNYWMPYINRFDCRWKKQSLQRFTTYESTRSNVFQRLRKSNESKCTTIKESILLNYLDIFAHYEIQEMLTLIQSLLIDDCDVVIGKHMSDVPGIFLVIETVIDVKSHCTSLDWCLKNMYIVRILFACELSKGGNTIISVDRSTLRSCFDWELSRLDNVPGSPMRRILPRHDEAKNWIVSTLCEVIPISTQYIHNIGNTAR